MTFSDNANAKAARAWRGMAEGTSLGTMTVVESTPQRLVLKGSARFSLVLILMGVGFIGGGLLALGEVASANANAKRGIHRSIMARRALLFPLFGALALVAGVSQLFDRVTVDGDERSVSGRRLTGEWKKRRKAISRVQLTVESAVRGETLRLELCGPGSDDPETLGHCRTDDDRTFFLANAAYETARLLDAPLVVRGKAEDGSPKFRALLEEIATDGVEPGRRAA
jgi:hypothetical protein